MFRPETLFIVFALAGGWLLQLWMSTQQMRGFHRHIAELRALGSQTSIGMAGNTYKRKTYVAIAVDTDGVVQGAKRLAGFTVFAKPKVIAAVVGLHLDELGSGAPPAGVDEKTWDAIDHAAEFIRRKLASGDAAEDDVNDGDTVDASALDSETGYSGGGMT